MAEFSWVWLKTWKISEKKLRCVSKSILEPWFHFLQKMDKPFFAGQIANLFLCTYMNICLPDVLTFSQTFAEVFPETFTFEIHAIVCLTSIC